jgi:hypothetical protein
MANATIAVGTYAGEAARPYVAAAIMSADTLANGYISTYWRTYTQQQFYASSPELRFN